MTNTADDSLRQQTTDTGYRRYPSRPITTSTTNDRQTIVTSRQDPAQQYPGPYKWYNRTHNRLDTGRTRGYDKDLDGPTPPPEDITYDEEDWDGTGLPDARFDDKHPLGTPPHYS